jgi:fibronectin-binding autotransporter adhesin
MHRDISLPAAAMRQSLHPPVTKCRDLACWRKLRIRFAIVCIAALWSARTGAIEINDFTAARNSRFASGYADGPLVANTDPSYIGLGYDWSGVGWAQSNINDGFALITPRQMLISNGNPPGVGQHVEFASASGQMTAVTVQSQPGTHAGIPPDMATAQFSSPIPQSAGISTYSILFQGYNPVSYQGYNLLTYGLQNTYQTPAIGWNQINGVDTLDNYGFDPPFTPDSAYYTNYLYDATTPDRAQVAGGDSGSPSFIATGSPGAMYLSGGHYLTVPGYTGIDTFLPLSLPALIGDTAPAGYLPSVVTPTTARWTGALSNTWSANASGNWALAASGAAFNDVLSGGTVTTCASLLFDGLLAPQHSISLSGSQAATSLAFNLTPSATGGFTFNGDSLTLGEAGLTNNDVHSQTFNTAIFLRASQQWQIGSGGITISTSGSLGLGSSQLLYLNGSGTSDFEGIVSGAGSGIAKDGGGTLILGNADNSFSGPIFVHNGTLQFASIRNVGGGNSALGAPTSAAGGIIYLAGTLAYVGSGSSSDRVIDVADGPGASGATGVIDASGAGPLNLSGGVICENASGASLLVLQGSASGSQSGAIVNGGAANVLSLVKTGSGTWNLSAVNSYTGTTLVNGGLLTVSGPSGSIAHSAALSISSGALQLDDSALADNFANSRLGSQPIGLQGGALILNLGNTSGGTETVGSITAQAGENRLALSTSGGSGILSAASLTRTPGATLNFTGVLSSLNRIALGGMPGGSNFIDAGTFVNGADYAVYDAGGFVRAMISGTSASDYAYDPAGPAGMTSRNVLLDTAYSSQPSLTVLTLSLSGGNSSLSLSPGQTLSLTAGGILKSGGGTATIGGGAGLMTTGEYVLRADTTGDQLAVTAPLGGGTGLTKSGLGTLVLAATGSTYGGATTVAAGTLQTAVAGAIPATSPLVIGNAAALDLAGQGQAVAGITLYDGAVVNSGAAAALTLGGSAAGVAYAGSGSGSSISGGTLNLSSPGMPSASHTFSVARGQGEVDLDVAADISDGSISGQSLVKEGNGILRLSGTNTFSGGILVEAGGLVLGNSYAIPATGDLAISDGTLELGGHANSAGSFLMQGGAVTGCGSLTAALFRLQSGSLAGGLTGAGALIKTTSGTVTIAGSNAYSGGTTLSGGVLAVSADNNLGLGALTIDGGTLQVLGTSFTSTSRPVDTSSNGGGIDVANPNNTLTLATQNLSGSGALVKAGQGGLQLGGSIGGAAITVQDGLLQLTGSASQLTASPALSLWNVATFALSNNNETLSAIHLTGGTINTAAASLVLMGDVQYARSIWPASIGGNLVLGGSAGVFAVDAGSSTDLTVAANISGSPAGGLVKSGSGSLTVSGSNTYSGGTTINAGTLLTVTPFSIPGYSAPGVVSVHGGAVLAVRTGDGVSGWNGGQIDSLLANIAWADNTAGLGIDTTGGDFTYGSNITQSLSLTKLGANTLTLSGSNTYSGGTNVNAGTLLAATTASLPGYNSPSRISVSGGAVLAVRSGDGKSGWNGGQIDTLVANAAWANVVFPTAGLGIDTSNGDFVYVGNITVPSLALTKLGSNLLTLTGTNSYAGGTTIAAGTLLAATTASLPGFDGSSLLSVARGAVLAVRTGDGASGWSGGQVDSLLANTAWADDTAGLGIDTTNGDFTYGNITQSLALVKLGSNALTLTGTNTYSGDTTVLCGTLQLLSPEGLGEGGLFVGDGVSSLFAAASSSGSPISAASLDTPSVGSASSLPGANPVPEPGTLLLLIVATGGGLLWGVRRHMGSENP